MNIKQVTKTIVASTLLIIPLEATAKPLKPTSIPVSYTTYTGAPLNDCPGGVDPAYSYVIRVVIPKKFSITDMDSRQVFFKPGTLNGNDDGKNDSDGQENPDQPRNPFHINIKAINHTAAHKYALVRVILRDTNNFMGFYEQTVNTSTGPKTIYGVSAGDGAGLAMMCGRRNITTNANGRPVASFFIQINDPASPTLPKDGMFSIGIIPREYPETPIIIDPKIRNNG